MLHTSFAPTSMPELRVGLPFVGPLRLLRNDRLGLQARLVPELGEVCWARVGPIHMIFVSSAELAHALLVEHADVVVKSRGLQIARALLGNGLLTSELPLHRRQRRLMAPAFAHRRIGTYAAVMSDWAERVVEQWPDGSEIDVSSEMMRLTLAIVGQALFGADVVEEATEIGEALSVANRYVSEEMTALLHLPWLPTPRNLRLRNAVARLDETVYRMIRMRRATEEDKGDVLSMLLLAREEGTSSGMSDRQVRDEVMTLFVAGHETTANALAWSLYLLGRHQEAMERLEQEVARELAGRAPTLDDLPRLPYTLGVVQEALRLYPPAYIVGRQPQREIALGPHRVPAGSTIFVNIYGMHRRPDYFVDPEHFDPDRFSPERMKSVPRGAYLPFGGGPRICIGNHFALMEAQIVLATIVQRVRLELASSDPIEPEPLVTLRPKHGVLMRVKHR